MKREIIFRGIHANRWVFGSLLTYTDEYHSIVTFDDKSIETMYPVNSKTVGQFTGLTDKNGVFIFEGDILSNGEICNLFVSFDNGSFLESNISPRKQLYLRMIEYGYGTFEVIGNIHNNPELL